MNLPGRQYTAPNGEIVVIGSGEVLGFENVNFPQLTTSAKNLSRFFDGVSAEKLGTIPKIIAISQKEQRLLSQLHPWKWLKYATRMDYYKLLNKINRHRLNTYLSIIMKQKWKDPNSIYNSPAFLASRSLTLSRTWANPNSTYNTPEFRNRLSLGIIKAWANPNSGFNTQKFRDQRSKHFKALWADPDHRIMVIPLLKKAWKKRFDIPGARERHKEGAKKAWDTRRKRYGETGLSKKPRKIKPKSVRDRARTGERCRWGYAWKRLGAMFDMLYAPSI